jgi:hypothetical protein
VKLTSEQEKAMQMLKECEKIIRYDGGFWSTPDAEMEPAYSENGSYFPTNNVGTVTIKALLRKNIIKVTKESPGNLGNNYPIECTLLENEQ